MTRKKDAGRSSEDDERRAYEAAMGGARPLPPDRRRPGAGEPPPPRPTRPKPAPPAPAVSLRALHAAADSGPYAYLAEGEPAARVRELRASRTRPEAVLDLHGHTTDDVRALLSQLLAAAEQRGQRLLLIVHGRGLGSGPAGPVLRARVLELLTAGPLAARVLAVVSAPPALGSDGAALVWLRRRR